MGGPRFSRFAFSVFVFLGLLGGRTCAQEAGTAALPSQAAQTSAGANPTRGATDRDVSLRALPRNLLSDQKDIWLFPTELAKGKHWIPAMAIVGVSAGLIASDPHTAPTFRTSDSFGGFNRAFSKAVIVRTVAEIL